MINEKLPEIAAPFLEAMKQGETVYMNPDYCEFARAGEELSVTREAMEDASRRLKRFAPFIRKCFPETEAQGGMIESPLTEIAQMKELLNETYGANLTGKLFLKEDNDLAVAGSVKARGGIYEILKHSEEIAFQNNLITEDDNYEKFAEPRMREFFGKYRIHAGSTGNLGLSIGIISAALGYDVTIHMSADAKQWKKDLLRQKGVHVKEYDSDFSYAVTKGREEAGKDPNGYFVDDENSKNLFLGYSVAAERLSKQLKDKGIQVDEEHPLFVYIPCGVGGAPGGITFGLKQIFGDHVHCFFVEPVQSPCMLLGLVTKLHNEICVQDIGLSGKTCADGLAVGRPSKFVGKLMEKLLAGEFTVEDPVIYDYMRGLLNAENIFIEPSSCAAFHGVTGIMNKEETAGFLKKHRLSEKMENAVHIVWATGGKLVPEEIREEYRNTFLA